MASRIRMKGDFSKLAKMVASASAAAGGDFVKRSVKGLGTVSHDLAVRGALTATAPTGRAWKPLKKVGGPALREMAGSIRLVITPNGVKLDSSKPWAGFHQRGARKRGTKWKLPIRRILPKKVVPKKWMKPMLRELEEQWLKTWKR